MRLQPTLRFAGLAFAVVFFLQGCALFEWIPGIDATPRVKPDRPKPLVEFEHEARIDVKWHRAVGRGLGKKYVALSPAISGENVIVGDAYGFVAALEAASGRLVWRTLVGRPDRKPLFDVMDRSDPSFVSGGFSTGEGTVLVGTNRGDVVALSEATGEELWRTAVSGEVLAPATTGRDTVVVQTSDGKVFALERDSGEQRWVFNSQDPIVTLRGTASPIVNAGVVFAGFANGMLSAIDIRTGRLLWEQRIALPEGTSELERMVDVDGTPLVGGGMVVASSHQGKTRAVRQTNGDILWTVEQPSHRALGTGYGLIYIVTDNDSIVAIDGTQAVEVWSQDLLERRELTDPMVYSNYVVVGDGDGWVHVFAQSDGRPLTRRKLGTGAIRSAMVQRDGTVYLLTASGRIVAFEINLV